jgi:hypothetical protein
MKITPPRGTLRVKCGKGSTYRPVNDEVYSRNYDLIFGNKKGKKKDRPIPKVRNQTDRKVYF